MSWLICNVISNILSGTNSFRSVSTFLSSLTHFSAVNRGVALQMAVFDGIVLVLIFILILLLAFSPTSVPLVKVRSINSLESWSWSSSLGKKTASSGKFKTSVVSETFMIQFIEVLFIVSQYFLHLSVMGRKNSLFASLVTDLINFYRRYFILNQHSLEWKLFASSSNDHLNLQVKMHFSGEWRRKSHRSSDSGRLAKGKRWLTRAACFESCWEWQELEQRWEKLLFIELLMEKA